MTKLRHTAKDWLLYSNMKGAATAARKLNRAYNTLVSQAYMRLAKTGTSKQEVADRTRDKMYKEMQQLEEFGAMDTVPRELLLDLLEKEFGVRMKMLS